jgi:hypothetical protein
LPQRSQRAQSLGGGGDSPQRLKGLRAYVPENGISLSCFGYKTSKTSAMTVLLGEGFTTKGTSRP